MSTDDWDPISAFARGDQLRAESLRKNLETIRDHAPNAEVRRLLDDVLAGRRSLREIVRDPAFEAQLDKGMAKFSAEWQELSPEERAELVRRGQAEEAQRRAELGLPERIEPEPEVGDSPLLREDY